MGAREQLYGRGTSRRYKKPASGFTDSASFVRMAKRFKRTATAKIMEKTGLGDTRTESPNLASHMAAALLTGGTSTPSPNKSTSFINDIF